MSGSATFEDLVPRQAAPFTPNEEARKLEAGEAFDAGTIDLRDLFDLSRPGTYRAQLDFDPAAGVGKGTSNQWHLRVVAP